MLLALNIGKLATVLGSGTLTTDSNYRTHCNNLCLRHMNVCVVRGERSPTAVDDLRRLPTCDRLEEWFIDFDSFFHIGHRHPERAGP